MNSNYHNHKEFVCPHCGKDFKKKRQLKSHIKDTHDKELAERKPKNV